VGSIDTGLVLKVLRPIWETKTKTAVDNSLADRTDSEWAKIHGYRDGENPARWKGHLDNALPKPSKIAKVTHLAAMPYDELPAFMGELRQRKGNGCSCARMDNLTAVRSDDSFGFTWPEVDTEKKSGPSQPLA